MDGGERQRIPGSDRLRRHRHPLRQRQYSLRRQPQRPPDLLPDEAGGYAGFQALYGAKYVNPSITGGNACVNDTAGNPIQDPLARCGFPGFDGMLAKNSLGIVAQMQENGVPVTFAYISDAHDNHTPPTFAYGPGEATRAH